MNQQMEEEYKDRQKEKDQEPSEMDDALSEYWSDHHKQEWTP